MRDITLEMDKTAPAQRYRRSLTAKMKAKLLEIGTRHPESRMSEIGKGLLEINRKTKDFLLTDSLILVILFLC